MALDRVSIAMLKGRIFGRVLCLGYPEHPDGRDTIDWLISLGAESVAVWDVIRHRGVEEIFDLNKPVGWYPLDERFEVIINPGTLEHCFNIGVAWDNSWKALSPGGYILHVFPASMFNHGFWNINPVAVYDWCEANGGEVVSARMALNGSGHEVHIEKITSSASGRGALPPEVVFYALCRKNEERATRWPTQGVYRR